jgi:hypothetical protein
VYLRKINALKLKEFKKSKKIKTLTPDIGIPPTLSSCCRSQGKLFN